MRYLNNTFKLLTGALVFLVFNCADCSGVKKEPSCNISNEFKSYVIFGVGSYWVYKSDEGILDTTKIISIERTIYDGPSMYPTESFRIYKNSSLKGDLLFEATCGSASVGDRHGCDENTTAYIFINTEYLQEYFFCCCEPDSNSIYANHYLGEDSVTINNIFYSHLKKFFNDSLNAETIKLLYYAKGIGLVKYEDYQENNWELIEHSIIEY